jgi:uncharacterized membrane protein
LRPTVFSATLPHRLPALTRDRCLTLGFNGNTKEVSMAFCSRCGTQIADGMTTCVACSGGTVVTPSAGAGMADNVAGMLAYITFIPAIIFLVTPPYNQSRFVRFHSYQSIFLSVAVFGIHVALSILTVVPFLIFITGPLHLLVSLGALIVWIILLLKANQGQMFKLPVIGDLAEKQAG